MTQNNSNQDNTSYWADNSPSIRNTPSDSVGMENVKFYNDFWGTDSYSYMNNGQQYVHDSLGTHLPRTFAQEWGLTATGLSASGNPYLMGIGTAMSAGQNILRDGWGKGVTKTVSGKILGFGSKNPVASTLLDNIGSEVGGKLYNYGIPQKPSSYTFTRGGLVISNEGVTESLNGSVGKNILNKDLSPSGRVLNGGVSETVYSSGTVLKGGVSENVNAAGETAKLSTNNAYTHPEINTDPTQRVLGKNGAAIESPLKLEGKVAETNLAASSAPANTNTIFKTPNMQSISKVLYSGVKLGAGMLTGYLMGRTTEMLLGKQGSKIVGKLQEYHSYYSMATEAMKTYAASTWTSITNSAFGHAVSTAWTALSNTIVGQAVAWVSSAISAVTTAITNVIVGVITAVAHAIATSAVGVAIASAVAWVAALAIPW